MTKYGGILSNMVLDYIFMFTFKWELWSSACNWFVPVINMFILMLMPFFFKMKVALIRKM